MNNTEEFKNKYNIKSAEDAVHFTAKASKQAKKGEIACILFDNLGNNERKSKISNIIDKIKKPLD